MLSIDTINPIYEIDGLDGLVLFINSKEKFSGDTVCAQVNYRDNKVDFLKLELALKFTPFNSVPENGTSKFLYRSFLYRKFSDKEIFNIFKELKVDDDE